MTTLVWSYVKQEEHLQPIIQNCKVLLILEHCENHVGIINGKPHTWPWVVAAMKMHVHQQLSDQLSLNGMHNVYVKQTYN